MAAAVRLQEGPAGVRRVIRTIGSLGTASTRAVARGSGLPLPVVAAISNELRARDVLTRDRPSRLTDTGQALLTSLGLSVDVPVTCTCCDGTGLQVPPELEGVVDELTAIASRAPSVDLTLDQAFCTPRTKVRRALLLLRHRLVPADGLLLIGDDDLFAITLAVVARRLGVPLATRVTVVDVSRPILDFLDAELGGSAELVEHDLREPLPSSLRGGFELAMTDPPYTPEGAALFLSRAVEGLAPGPANTIVFSFGAKGPHDALEVQDAVASLALVTSAAYPDFNYYDGAGVISGRSTLSLLTTTAATGSDVARWDGGLYTADRRAADRAYRCVSCRAQHVVGPSATWPTVGALKAAGCPECGGTRFRPLSLVTGGES